MIEFAVNFIELFEESAPWLLLGLLVAGAMKWLVPMSLLNRHMGKSDLLSIIKAALIGAPLPLCSCGVIPAAVGLRRSGASKPATVSFLVATPETGVDSISVSYALLGPFLAIIRPFSAIFSAVYAGLITRLVQQDGKKKASNNQNTAEKVSSSENNSCCGTTSSQTLANKEQSRCDSKPVKANSKTENLSCCAGEKKHEVNLQINWLQRVREMLQFSTGKLLTDITKWLLIGLVVAAAVKTWVAQEFLTQWGSGFGAMLVMALVGIPMYICATASTPVAAGFLAMGVSPGAVLVFMLAGPATNLSTMGMIRQEMGSRVLAGYLFAVISASIGLGYFTNWSIQSFGFEVAKVASEHHQLDDSFLYTGSALLLALLMLRNVINTTRSSLQVNA
ncbi:SO_0444 family Cu/Zn efflux transporter [Aliikangiella sp. G2MR2-5]|uniref:SO_0444 family Cu/Zn efflux transporter n=1 Tax=Aliikangiella sp. G2MR2-5 TaxID=2788943 RepID=UPI0018A9D61B|nr:SO_0444 family Cu/Zn efflux transporter [Aliikangiella sp. G2MR2-5]